MKFGVLLNFKLYPLKKCFSLILAKNCEIILNPVRNNFFSSWKDNISTFYDSRCFFRRFLAENVLIWRNLLFHSGFMLWCLIDSVAFAEVSLVQAVQLLAVAAVFVGPTTVLDDLKLEVD